MEERHLHFLIASLDLLKEYHSAFDEAAEHPLDQTAAFQNFVIVPLHLEHPPVLLNLNGAECFLISPFFGLTKRL